MVAPTAHCHPNHNYDVNPFYRSHTLSLDVECFVSKIPELLRNQVIEPLNRVFSTRHHFHGVGLLDIEDGDMEHILRTVQSPNIIWIRWYRCPFSSLPCWIPMKYLKYLEVGGSALETLWQDQSQAKPPM
jgi:hypothetical protein